MATHRRYDYPENSPACFGRGLSAAMVDGRLWAVTSFEEAGQEGIAVLRETADGWTRVRNDLPGNVQQPCLAADGNTAVVAWSEWEQNCWAVRVAAVDPETATLQAPSTVATGQGVCLPPGVAVSGGQTLVAWACLRDGAVGVQVARRAGKDGEWVLETAPDCSGDAFRPCVGLSGGTAYLAWDEYHDGTYRVCVARRAGQGWETVAQVGQGGERHLCPRLAVLPGGDAVVTWVVLREVHDDLGIADHEVYAMLARVTGAGACVVADPALAQEGPFAADLREGLLAAETYLGYNGLRRNPQVTACPEDGSAWLTWEARMEEENSARAGRLVGRRLDAGGNLGKPACLHRGGYSYAVPAQAPDGPAGAAFLVCAAEGWEVVQGARLETAAAAPHAVEPGRWRRWKPGLVPESPRPEGAVSVAGRSMQLFWADTHCHSVYCPDAEGEVDELIHFARDIAGLDAVAVVDNDYYPHKVLTQAEWQVEQELARHFTRNGEFVVFPAWEFTYHRPDLDPNYNHRTVMYPGPGGPLFRRIDPWADSDRKLAAALAGTGAMSAPHHCTWELLAPDLEWGAEVVSSWRVCLEETEFVIPQLQRGAKFGFLGASDTHRSVPGLGGALTGIFAEELTPEALFEAYRARRTLATQGFRLWAEFRVAGEFMGGETQVSAPPPVQAKVRAPEPLEFVEVVRDGEAIHRVEPDGAECELDFTDAGVAEGEHFYFLRVKLQGDPSFNMPPGKSLTAHDRNSRYPHNLARARGVFAWTSPVWVTVE